MYEYGCCGFIAWEKEKVVAYNNFFPIRFAGKVKFYGYGFRKESKCRTLIHNCLSIVKGDEYLRKGVSTKLIKASLDWAKKNDWEKFEVHMVLPDCEKGWIADQKSCLSFWQKMGFKIFKEYDADEMTQKYYGVTKRYSICLFLDRYNS